MGNRLRTLLIVAIGGVVLVGFMQLLYSHEELACELGLLWCR